MKAFFAAVLAFILCAPGAFAREWIDSTGKHTFEAEFVSFDDGKVLLRAEGRTAAVPIEKLSDADQAFVRKQKAKPAAECLADTCKHKGRRRNDPIRVLFIGNSHVYHNSIPELFAAVTRSGARYAVTGECAPGNFTFEKHLTDPKDGKAAQAITQSKPDIVILQEHGSHCINEPKSMLENGRKLDQLVKAQGAKTLLYLMWAQQGNLPWQERINKAYFQLAQETGAAVAPVGIAWRKALNDNFGLVLHESDGNHANLEGAYLTTCVFFARIFGKCPVGLSGDLRQMGFDCQLAPAKAKILQEAAWAAVESLPTAAENAGK